MSLEVCGQAQWPQPPGAARQSREPALAAGPAANPDLSGMHEMGCSSSSAWDAGDVHRDELTPLLQSRS